MPAPLALSRSGEHIRLHRGVYLDLQHWNSISEEDRHLSRMLAAQRSASKPLVFSHISAAVLLGFPIYGSIGTAVHTISPHGKATRPTTSVTRHRAMLNEDDVICIEGLQCTSAERTLLDLARFLPPTTSLPAIDGFLRHEFKIDHQVDWESHAQWSRSVDARLSSMRGERGVRRARQVFELADPRIDSVLESVSHLYLRQLGFDVELQVPVASPRGGSYYVDFEFLGLNLFGECDGKAKYANEAMRSGLSIEEVMYREKRRQDWICGTTKKDLIRWGSSDVASATSFARRLRSFGVRIPRIPG